MLKGLKNFFKIFELQNNSSLNSSTEINKNTALKSSSDFEIIKKQMESLKEEIKTLKQNVVTQEITEPSPKKYEFKEIFPNKLYSFDNFLNEQECNQVIQYIDQHKVKSKTVNSSSGVDEYSDYRTSSTCYIEDQNIDFIKKLDEKICLASNEKYALGERIQGQFYEVGQEFKEHTDWFQGKGYETNCAEQGNRTTTFMIYLNEVEEGGETFFPRLNLRFKPKRGMAIMWRNLDIYGEPDDMLLHSGEPILKGNKYIVTKWFRERVRGTQITQTPQIHSNQTICGRAGSEILHEHNLLSSQECSQLIEMIDQNKQKSTVVEGEGRTAYSEHRTSSSSYFDGNDQFVKAINKKLSDFLGIHPGYSEGVQGQLYEVGQEFKHHHDFFHNTNGKDEQFNIQGDRTWSIMVFLNKVEEGGETDFPEHNLQIIPEPGLAVFWKNTDIYGNQNFNTLHAGLPVLKGKKYIITKWFRQFSYERRRPQNYLPESFQARSKELLKAHSVNNLINNEVNQNEAQSQQVSFQLERQDRERVDYQKISDVPIFTDEGFVKIKVPPKTWSIIQDAYQIAKPHFKDEYNLIDEDPENLGSRKHLNSDKFPVGTLFSGIDDEASQIITEDLRLILQEWSGRDLTPTATYGFRSYRDGCELKMHVDRLQTHVISATICVDQKVNKHWPLDIFNHESEEFNVNMETGEMILYESARLVHGRQQRLDGESYVGLFVHFIPT